jgi:hypothetical protein
MTSFIGNLRTDVKHFLRIYPQDRWPSTLPGVMSHLARSC